MNILRITCTALSLMSAAVPVHAQTSLPDIPATQIIFPERAELQLNPDPEVFPPGPDLFFGYALALRENTLLAGMPSYQGGRVAVFTRTARRQPWERRGSLDPADQGGGFGTDIALGKAFAMVQADSGTYVFHRKKGTWTQTQKLPVRFTSMAIGSGFLFGLRDETVAVFRPDKRGRLQRVQTLIAGGASLAVSHGTLVVGAPGDFEGRGSVHIFKRHGQKWSRHQQLIAINGEPGDNFGASVSIDRGLIAIGAPEAQSHGPDCLYVRGVAYVFAPDHGLWFERQKVETPSCEPFAYRFAFNIALSGGRLAADVPGAFPFNGHYAFIYENRAGTFSPTAVTDGVNDLEQNGPSMQMFGSTLVLGFPFERGGYSPGSASIFDLGRRCMSDDTVPEEDAESSDDGEHVC